MARHLSGKQVRYLWAIGYFKSGGKKGSGKAPTKIDYSATRASRIAAGQKIAHESPGGNMMLSVSTKQDRKHPLNIAEARSRNAEAKAPKPAPVLKPVEVPKPVTKPNPTQEHTGPVTLIDKLLKFFR